ncbi:MAG: DUF2283 domain-containing protein [Candidatus Aenigmarchaeota archaeon]|nr:DUF2283 domain-containing protein [Candidatus Aenigmarchaeota archaeon]MDI6722992.1 DUF2283 domain-containing protein [Candidatus Aenigmarchaeota archaeon]
MKYKYDAKADVLVISLSSEKPDFGEQRENIITHYNKKGKPVEIEILDASKTALDMIRAMLPKKVV